MGDNRFPIGLVSFEVDHLAWSRLPDLHHVMYDYQDKQKSCWRGNVCTVYSCIGTYSEYNLSINEKHDLSKMSVRMHIQMKQKGI